MCSNYIAVTRTDRMLSFFGVAPPADARDSPSEVWPTGIAPFIRLTGEGQRVVEGGHFGPLPSFAKEVAYGRRTYNARSETVATLASFRDSWRRGLRCIVPAESIFEPCWESGKAVRWSIQQPGAVPMGIAGIYSSWITPQGVVEFSFTMLTVNADGHAVYQRMHRPGEEKRMVVILAPEDYDAWLTCPVAQASRYFRPWTGPLDAEPAPLPARAPRTTSGKVVVPPPQAPAPPPSPPSPPPGPGQADLF